MVLLNIKEFNYVGPDNGSDNVG